MGEYAQTSFSKLNVMTSNCVFCLSNSSKPKDIYFKYNYKTETEKQQILTFETLEIVNFLDKLLKQSLDNYNDWRSHF